MKSFRIFVLMVLAGMAVCLAGADVLLCQGTKKGGRPYQVEIHRMAREVEEKGLDAVSLSECDYVTNIERYNNSEDFYDSDSDYVIQKIGGVYYRFDYQRNLAEEYKNIRMAVHGILVFAALLVLSLLVFIDRRILYPLQNMMDVPFELAKGNLTIPLKESRNHLCKGT